MISVQRALVFSFAERYALIGLSLVSNIVLARLLTPAQIGIYSVSLAVIGIAQVLRDFGIGNFLIQVKDLQVEHVRTAFGISLVIGTVLFVVVYLAAPAAGTFYGEAQMVLTLRISALNFLVLPFCSISVALLRRAMEFQRLVFVTLGATALGLVVTIGLAYAGFGPNSMAIGALVANVATGAGSRLARRERESIMPSFSQWRELLNFGAQSSVTSVVTTISMDINDLAIGKILGFAPVAIISRAQGLMFLFSRDLMTAIRNVAYPAYAHAHREGEILDSRYVESVGSVTVLAWPFYAFCAVFSLEIMRLLFGSQWDASAELVPVFSIAGCVAATTNLISTIMLAMGRVGLVTRSELLLQPFRAVLIIGAAMIFESLMACALAFLVATIVSVPLLYWYKQQCIPTEFASLRRMLGRSLLVTVAAMAVPIIVAVYAGLDRTTPVNTPLFLATAAVALLGWLVALPLLRHPVLAHPTFMDIKDRIRRMFASRR